MIRTLRPSAQLRPTLRADAARRAVLRWWRRRSPRLEPLLAWRGAAWRRRWFGLGTASLICLIGGTGILLLPNHYRSSALLFADPGRGVVLSGGAEAWTAAALAALRQALLAPAALERIAGAPPLPATQGPAAATSDRPGRLAERIAIAAEGPALFRVSYRADRPDAAERTLQALVDLVTSGQTGPMLAADALAPTLRAGPSVAGLKSQASIATALPARRDQAAALWNDLAAALALRDARARQLAGVPPVLAAGRPNPGYEQAAIRLGQQETLVAGLRHQLAAAAAAIATLEGQLEAWSGDQATPADLGARRGAPAAAAGLIFRMVAPPSRPPGPESPLHLWLLAGVAIAGIAVGTAVAVWRGQQDGMVDCASQLARRFRLPVLGTISAPARPGQHRRQHRIGIDFGLACLVLLVLFGSLATAEALDLLAPLSAPRGPLAG